MNTYFSYLVLITISLISLSPPSQKIEVIKLEKGVYVYRSFAILDGEKISANGLILESSHEVALIDTPWDDEQTVQVLDWIEREIDKPISFTVVTHAHMDRIGGINVLKSHNISTISGRLTAKEATQNGYAQPDLTFQSDTLLTYGNSSLEAYYPGPGHTLDNTVIYLNDQHILYGGCFIKSTSSTSLGNIEDAKVAYWSSSLRKVLKRYPDRKLVIPGHGNWKPGSIQNTLNLLSKTD